jgi:hypothetical protein
VISRPEPSSTGLLAGTETVGRKITVWQQQQQQQQQQQIET